VLTGSTPTGLHLVGDEQDAPLVADLLESPEHAVGRSGESAHSLNRLEDQRGNVPGGTGQQHVAEVCSDGLGEVRVVQMPERGAEAIAVVDVVDVERGETRCRPARVAGDADRGERTSVVAVAKGQNLIRPPVLRGQQQRRVVGL
jgi:hypothetical protein